MTDINDAIARLSVLALDCSSSDVPVEIRLAPEKPIEDASTLPMTITHLITGQGTAVNKTDLQFEPTIAVDFHHNRMSLKQCYTEINSVTLSFMARLAGDPTLGGSVDTIIFPVTFEVVPTEWDRTVTQMLRFSIPVKTLETPITGVTS